MAKLRSRYRKDPIFYLKCDLDPGGIDLVIALETLFTVVYISDFLPNYFKIH